MNTLNHTPTRWFLHRPTTSDHWEIRAQAKKPPVKVLADVWAAGDTREESEANARLIAAAPDLLAACQEVSSTGQVQEDEDGDCAGVLITHEAWAWCQEAIARATGNAIPTPAVSENLNQPL